MALSVMAVKNAKPKEKAYKLFDERGLYLLVSTTGHKYWRFDYTFGGKRKTASFGVFPEITLAEAREKRDEARKQIREGVDPMEAKRQRRQAEIIEATSSLRHVTLEYLLKNKESWTPKHYQKLLRQMEKHVFPWLAEKSIRTIKPTDLLPVLQRIEDQGLNETAHRVAITLDAVFRDAIIVGKAESNPAAAIKGALKPNRPKHRAAIIDPAELGALLRAIDGYKGNFIVRCALRLLPYLFCRPGELRHLEWVEIDWAESLWRIPAGKMKMRRPHLIPLSKQALSILDEIRPLTGTLRYAFPSMRTNERPISDNTFNAALRRLGYSSDEHVSHGFRTSASTLLHEHGFRSDVIERQLAHVEKNSVKAAYCHADFLKERREMMQAWADYLDRLREGGK